MAVIGFEWNQQDDVVNHLSLIKNKTLILSNGEYEKWNQGTQQIRNHPIMTSDTLPYGIVRASGFNSTIYSPYKAFTLDNASGWSEAGKNYGWISYESINEIIVGSYSMKSRSTAGDVQMPKKWTFEGSDDGQLWEILHQVDSKNNWSYPKEEFFNIQNPKYFKYHRINVAETNSTVLAIGQIQFFNPTIPPSWSTVSTTLPTSTQFTEQGMDSLSPLLDRKVTTLEPQEMNQDTTWTESGKVFKKSIDLKKYFDIRSINITN